MSRRTLRNIRLDAPEPDRREPALAPNPEPRWATAQDGTRYVHINLYPRTLDELRKQCREFGEAAVIDLQWSCVLRWLMWSPNEADLSSSFPVAMTATRLVRDHDRISLGLPRHDGGDWNPSALNYLSREVREEAERTAADTLSDWAKAGKPYLSEHLIKGAYKQLVSCPAFAEKYVSLPTFG